MLTRLVAAMAVLLCGACASYSEVRFAPPLQDAELRDGTAVKARIAVAWLGAYQQGDGYELCFRIRVDNPGPDAFKLEPARFELLDAVLAPVGQAQIDALPPAVEGGEVASFEVTFHVPKERDPDDENLSALQLHAELDGNRWAWVTSFNRVRRYAYYGYPYPYGYPYSYPWWGSPWSCHAGVFWCHPI
jgi:hypothetical protein